MPSSTLGGLLFIRVVWIWASLCAGSSSSLGSDFLRELSAPVKMAAYAGLKSGGATLPLALALRHYTFNLVEAAVCAWGTMLDHITADLPGSAALASFRSSPLDRPVGLVAHPSGGSRPLGRGGRVARGDCGMGVGHVGDVFQFSRALRESEDCHETRSQRFSHRGKQFYIWGNGGAGKGSGHAESGHLYT